FPWFTVDGNCANALETNAGIVGLHEGEPSSSKKQESPRSRLDAVKQCMSEMRIGPSEGVEVPELKDDTSRLRYVELRKAIDPRSEVRYVVLGHGELSLCVSVEICRGLPARRGQRVHA